MQEKFFQFPAQLDVMCADIDKVALTLTHVYFCPQLLASAERVKGKVLKCGVLWADLDTCSPQNMEVPASIVVQSSAGRWQAYWRLTDPLEPLEAEALCRNIAYFHADQGADRSGWDLTQLLRVPYTPNYKYGGIGEAPLVVVIDTQKTIYRPSDFGDYPTYTALKFTENPLPEPDDLPKEDPLEILQRYRSVLNPQAFGLYNDSPIESELGKEKWSGRLWRLGKICAEAGMSPEETFVIMLQSKCNKYARDGRPETSLWREVQKIYVKEVEAHNLIPTPTAVIPNLITSEEIKLAQSRRTFVERYIDWASEATDAATQYHQAGAFTILSAILGGSVNLPTSFGTIKPNMWFMLAADTTITRKSTALNIAMDLLNEINDNAILATEGSPEGILTALKDRAGQPSIYLRDEFSGLIDQMTRTDYMAGFAELLTKLYDGKQVKRLLRKEEIIVRDPIFVIFCASVKTKLQNLLNDEHVNSGFIPRFVFITAEPDLSRVRPIGPPRPISVEDKERIKDELITIDINFNRPRMIVIPGSNGGTATIKPMFQANLTEEAWDRYNQLETTLINAAIETGLPHLTPMYDRLAKSTLKAALLIAASRQGEKGDITVDVEDVIHAIYYARNWHAYASEIVNGIGKSPDERMMDRILYFVNTKGAAGVSRSDIMRTFPIDHKKAELYLTTIFQRRQVIVTQHNGQPRYVGTR